MTEVQPPSFQAGKCYTSASDRQLWEAIVCGEGVQDKATGDLLVSVVGAQVQVAAGDAFIAGDATPGAPGMYYVVNDGTVNVAGIVAPGSGTYRYAIVATVYDDTYDTSGQFAWALEAIVGPDTSATPPTLGESTAFSGRILLGYIDITSGGVVTLVSDNRGQASFCESLVGAAIQPPTQLVFTASTTFDKTLPQYQNLRAVKATVIGGGGGGGAAAGTSSGSVSAGAGGGGGGYASRIIPVSSLPSSTAVTVGAGGAAGVSGGGAGAPGGITSFHDISATGGGGGGNGPATTGSSLQLGGEGGAGLGPAGTLNLSGGDGEHGRTQPFRDSADTASQFVIIPGGRGGAAAGGAGGRRDSTAISGPGVNGYNYGGGGSGARNFQSQSAADGGAGAAGVVVLELFY